MTRNSTSDQLILSRLTFAPSLLVRQTVHICKRLHSAAGYSFCMVLALLQVQLKGHRSVGGMRASIYNSMPLEGIHQLVDFMKEFKATHQQAHWTQPM